MSSVIGALLVSGQLVGQMNKMLLRIFLLILYVLASWVTSLLFIRSDGGGSHAPPAILFSWGVLPGEFGLVSKPVGFWFLPVLYLLCLFGLTTKCADSPWLPLSLAPFVIHAVGMAMALVIVTQRPEHAANVTSGSLSASYSTAGLLAGAYLLCGWLLARKPNKRDAPEWKPHLAP